MLAHHLRILDARAQLELRFRWIPQRILAAHFSQAKAFKIPDGMLVFPLQTGDSYWGFRAHVAVEVELQWKSPEQRRCDAARMVAGLGHSYGRILLLAETAALAAEWVRTIKSIAGKSVEINLRGKEQNLQIPEWVPHHVDIRPIEQARSWTPSGGYVFLRGRTFDDWWAPRSHWGVLEKAFRLKEEGA